MNPLFLTLQLAFDALMLATLLWVWSRNRAKPQAARPEPVSPESAPDFESLLQVEEATRRLHEAIQAADARLRAMRVSVSEVSPEPNQAYGAVWALYRRGLDARSIAQELSLSQAEVRLVLSLKDPQDPSHPVDN